MSTHMTVKLQGPHYLTANWSIGLQRFSSGLCPIFRNYCFSFDSGTNNESRSAELGFWPKYNIHGCLVKTIRIIIYVVIR